MKFWWRSREGKPTSFVVCVCEDEEDILKDSDEELLEKLTGNLGIGLLGHVVHEFDAHIKTSILDLTIVVFAGPHARINDEFELPTIQLEQRGEAIQIYRLEELEELHSVLRVFGEIFVDHLKRTFKDIFHNRGHFIGHESLL